MAAAKHIADARERVTEYINSLPDWSKKICKRLREIVLKSDPKMIEDWKWGPNYYLEGMVCGFAAFQKHVNFVFFRGALLRDKRKILKGDPGTVHMRHFKFREVTEINEDILLEYLIEAIDTNKKGMPKKTLQQKTVTLPADLKKALRVAGFSAYFESLAFSHRKEYVRWIEDAKKEETRLNRIHKAIILLGEKRMLNDKYKK